jgi:uncharacterized Tic20 family protein
MEQLPPPPDVTTPMQTAFEPNKDDRTWAMLAHLSIIIASFVGGLMFLGPLLVWLVKKDQSAFVDMHGKEALNFSISWTIWLLISVIFAVITCGIGAIVTIGMGIAILILSIIAGIAANEGREYRYPLTIRLVN